MCTKKKKAEDSHFQTFQTPLLCNAMRVHVRICLRAPPLSCECARSRRGSRLCVRGVICFYRGWQLITNPDKHRGRAEGGEREWGSGGKREGEREGGRGKKGGRLRRAARGIDIWIPLGNRRALWILTRGSGAVGRTAAHLALWQLIDPRRWRYT